MLLRVVSSSVEFPRVMSDPFGVPLVAFSFDCDPQALPVMLSRNALAPLDEAQLPAWRRLPSAPSAPTTPSAPTSPAAPTAAYARADDTNGWVVLWRKRRRRHASRQSQR